MKLSELKIDPEFEAINPALTGEERTKLEENILSDGIVFSPLIIWNQTIIDGHNRYRILMAHQEIEYSIQKMDFDNRDQAIAWICKNQLGRRNITLEQRKYLIAKEYEAVKAAKDLWERDKLEYHGSAEKLKNHYEFKELLNRLYSMDWVVYTKEAFGGAQSVINYLGRYTHRIAISNKRILRIEGENVVYLAKDYKNRGKLIEHTVSGIEFLRMFLMHVLPKGFVRIRHYGLLSCRNKKLKITLCRNLLGCQKYISQLRGKTVAEKIRILYQHDICKCKNCGEPLHTYRIDGRYQLC